MFIEQLEDRQMLSASAISLSHGVLTVRGTAGDDQINVYLQQKKIVVSDIPGGKRQVLRKFAPSQIRQIKISGGDGNDNLSVVLSTFKGKTTAFGDGKNDHVLVATNGPATLLGGDGQDVLTANGNKKGVSIDGGNDNDALADGFGPDTLVGGPGNDYLNGSAGGKNVMRGGDGTDTMVGGPGDDQLFGDADIDFLFGYGGNDTLDGGSGGNVMFGGAGDDIFHVRNGEEDQLAGDDGNDTADVDVIDVTQDEQEPLTPDALDAFQHQSKIEVVNV